MATKERDIEILEARIADLEIKINQFVAHRISDVKTDRLIAKKERYEQQLADLKA